MDNDELGTNNVTNAVLRALRERDGLTRAELKEAIHRARPDVKGSSIRPMLGRMLERGEIRIDSDARFWLAGGPLTSM
jgi:hypothetical protein